jgi:hypothetical protein
MRGSRAAQVPAWAPPACLAQADSSGSRSPAGMMLAELVHEFLQICDLQFTAKAGRPCQLSACAGCLRCAHSGAPHSLDAFPCLHWGNSGIDGHGRQLVLQEAPPFAARLAAPDARSHRCRCMSQRC